MPYLLAEDPRQALVIGLGGANTVDAFTRTAVAKIETVELEPRVVDAVRVLYEGRRSPLDDPRVDVRIGDGRHTLLLGARDEQKRYDVIASQPSHPWLAGAANLFTEEFFGLARDNLSSGGIFALWVNGFRTDPESVLALVSSFERVFPGALLIDAGSARPRDSLILLGAHQPIRIDLDRMRARFEEPDLRSLLALYEIERLEQILALSEGPTSAFAAIDPNASNTDDNAFVETRIPRRLDWSVIDFSEIEEQLATDAPVLAPASRPIDVVAVAKALLEAAASRVTNETERWAYAGKLARLVRVHGDAIPEIPRAVLLADAELRSPATAASAVDKLRELADRAPEQWEALRVLGLYLAREKQDFAGAAEAFASAYQRSHDAQDAFDAGRALFYVDPQGAFAWFDKIPASERSRFSRLALYDADRAARFGERGEDIRPEYDALLRFYDTAEGRSLPLALDILASVVGAAGDRDAALRFGDLAREKRRSAGAAALARARSLFAGGKLSEASAALEEGRRLLPADPGSVDLAVRIAHAQGDPAAVASALAALRAIAPSLSSAIEAENRLRASLGLPFLPDLAAGELFQRHEDRLALQERRAPVP